MSIASTPSRPLSAQNRWPLSRIFNDWGKFEDIMGGILAFWIFLIAAISENIAQGTTAISGFVGNAVAITNQPPRNADESNDIKEGTGLESDRQYSLRRNLTPSERVNRISNGERNIDSSNDAPDFNNETSYFRRNLNRDNYVTELPPNEQGQERPRHSQFRSDFTMELPKIVGKPGVPFLHTNGKSSYPNSEEENRAQQKWNEANRELKKIADSVKPIVESQGGEKTTRKSDEEIRSFINSLAGNDEEKLSAEEFSQLPVETKDLIRKIANAGPSQLFADSKIPLQNALQTLSADEVYGDTNADLTERVIASVNFETTRPEITALSLNIVPQKSSEKPKIVGPNSLSSELEVSEAANSGETDGVANAISNWIQSIEDNSWMPKPVKSSAIKIASKLLSLFSHSEKTHVTKKQRETLAEVRFPTALPVSARDVNRNIIESETDDEASTPIWLWTFLSGFLVLLWFNRPAMLRGRSKSNR